MGDIDFGGTASDYGSFRAGFPAALFQRLKNFSIGEAGQRLLDLGTGTGYLGRGFAQAGCVVTGLDPSDALMTRPDGSTARPVSPSITSPLTPRIRAFPTRPSMW